MKVNSDYYRNCLKEQLSCRIEKNARYSLRAYAKGLKVDVSDLSKVLSGKKALSIPSAEKVTISLGLGPNERDEFMLSVFEDHQRRGRKHKYPEIILKEINRDEKGLDQDIFNTDSHWYHTAILELTHTEDIPSDSQIARRRVSKRLGIGQTEAGLAIERLLKLDLLVEEKGVFKKSNKQFKIPTEKSMAATNKFLKQSLKKCEESLDNCPVDYRKNKVVTLAIDPKKLQEAKALIDDFQIKLMKLMATGQRESIYQLAIGLYPVELNFRGKNSPV